MNAFAARRPTRRIAATRRRRRKTGNDRGEEAAKATASGEVEGAAGWGVRWRWSCKGGAGEMRARARGADGGAPSAAAWRGGERGV